MRQPPDGQQPYGQPSWGQQSLPSCDQPQYSWSTIPNPSSPQFRNPQPQQPFQNTMGYGPVQLGSGGRKAWRARRLIGILLLIGCAILVVSAGVLAFLTPPRQNPQTSQWVHLPPGARLTVPTNGYLFKDPTGGYVVYNFPTTPPAMITWRTYRNKQDGYAIDCPSNWVQAETTVAGHAGFIFYPQGTNLSENVPGGSEGVGFRWVKKYQPPTLTDPTITDMKSIIVDGITGQLYTQGSLGTAIIVTFPYKNGSFILTADADSDVLIYVFQHMLQSLKFA